MADQVGTELLDDLIEILRNFDGREYSGSIDRATLFFGDLGLVSIDAIVLAELLETRYHRRFPFNAFLAELSQRGAQDLSVGELVDFLSAHLSVEHPEN